MIFIYLNVHTTNSNNNDNNDDDVCLWVHCVFFKLGLCIPFYVEIVKYDIGFVYILCRFIILHIIKFNFNYF